MGNRTRPDRALDEFVRRARGVACRYLIRDRGGAKTPTVVVAGVARSGTTWLAEVLAASVPTREMFEPFHSVKVERYRGFEYLQYVRPDADAPELFGFADDVLRGRIRDPRWIDQNVTAFRPHLRVVKDVRICMFLRWLSDRFPDVPMVYLVRHPCAVVASHLGLGWSMEHDFRSILAQPALIEDHLVDHVEWMRGLDDPLDRVAVIWCVENLVALRQIHGSRIPVVFYENMVRHADRVLPAVFDAVGLEFDEGVLTTLGRRSSTVFEGTPFHAGEDPTVAWTRRLSSEQVRRVLDVVERFGLGHLYRDTDPGVDPVGFHAVEV